MHGGTMIALERSRENRLDVLQLSRAMALTLGPQDQRHRLGPCVVVARKLEAPSRGTGEERERSHGAYGRRHGSRPGDAAVDLPKFDRGELYSQPLAAGTRNGHPPG